MASDEGGSGESRWVRVWNEVDIDAVVDGLTWDGQPLETVHGYHTTYYYRKLTISDTTELELTISIHPVYQVLVCHLRVLVNGRAQFVLDNCPELAPQIPVVVEEHLGTPWMCVHPCETNQYMAEFSSLNDRQWFTTWWSTYGPPAVFARCNYR
ncbi:hypothetical protein DICA3_F04896 [Diutina catenulata]